MPEKIVSPGKTIACSAPYGGGGLGQHLAQVVEEARQREALQHYFAFAIKPGDAVGTALPLPALPWILNYTPLRFSPGGKNHFGNELFDRAVAARLTLGESYVGFVGQSLRSFRQARHLGYKTLELEAANSHVCNVVRQHAKAFRQYKVETQSWLNKIQCRKTQHEYEMADVIVVASEYTRQSFLAEGFLPEKLRLRRLLTHPRFQPSATRSGDGIFRVVYTGSLTVMKGIPVLLEAFSRISGKAELVLVGGWTSRSMKQYLKDWQAREPRLKIAPGDPLPYLHQADVYVHPSYEDGWAYAPAEALACGVPVIVTEDTGMKELVQEGINGYVIPTGDWEAILERLEQCRKSPLVITDTVKTQ